MQKHLESVPDNKFYLLDNDFNRTAKQVFIILMGRAPEGKTDSMDWVTMKNYRHKCRELIQTLETRIQNVAVEERNKNFLSSKQLSFKSRKEGIVSTIGSTTTLSTTTADLSPIFEHKEESTNCGGMHGVDDFIISLAPGK